MALFHSQTRRHMINVLLQLNSLRRGPKWTHGLTFNLRGGSFLQVADPFLKLIDGLP